MKKNLICVLTLVVSTVLFSGFAFAQTGKQTVSSTQDLYVISAKAGGVNYVEGKVGFVSKNKRSGYLLKGDKVEVGDKILTGNDGKAEILLNPGSYIRLAENSKFEFLNNSLDNLELNLSAGSAMLEVYASSEFVVAVKTPKADFKIVSTGVYRVSVLNDGSGKIAVWKGKAQIGDFNQTEIKSGKEAVVNGGAVAVAKFDRDEKDSLEDWSKARSKDLAKANSRLQGNDVRSSLINSFSSNRWNMYNSFGLWVFDASFGGYCFLPFGYGWSSPYGFDYGRSIWYYRLPRVIFIPPTPTTVGSGGTTVAEKTRVRTIREIEPPYQSVQPKRERQIFDRANDNPFPSSMPSSIPSSSGGDAPAGKTRTRRDN